MNEELGTDWLIPRDQFLKFLLLADSAQHQFENSPKISDELFDNSNSDNITSSPKLFKFEIN